MCLDSVRFKVPGHATLKIAADKHAALVYVYNNGIL